jgi:phosphate transport system substrate-binding protein
MFYLRTGTLLLLVVVLLSACGGSAALTSSEALIANGELVAFAPRAVTGTIAATGSSTVYPLTLRMAREFRNAGSPAEVGIGLTGTGAGFRAFCGGAPVDLVNASRAISDEEAAACRAVGREPIGFQIGIDALAVVVPQSNTFVKSLTFAQLKQIFSGQTRTWAELDPSYPPVEIAVFSPGADSGTFDFFVDQVLDGDDQAILNTPGVVTSEDDEVLLKGIVANPYAIGYFGYAYYKAEPGRLRALAIDSGSGPVAPTQGTAQSGSYPLSRPLFLYSSQEILREKPQVAAFVSYYLRFVELQIDDVGYFTASRTIGAQTRADLVAVLQGAS